MRAGTSGGFGLGRLDLAGTSGHSRRSVRLPDRQARVRRDEWQSDLSGPLAKWAGPCAQGRVVVMVVVGVLAFSISSKSPVRSSSDEDVVVSVVVVDLPSAVLVVVMIVFLMMIN